MSDILKTSKFWNYLGMALGGLATIATGYGAILASKEADIKLTESIQETIENVFNQKMGEGVQINKI